MPQGPRQRPVEIEDLWRGASSQPPWKRLPGQVAEAINCRLDLADGAIHRFPTTLVANLDTDTTDVPLDPDGDYIFTMMGDKLIALGNDGSTSKVKEIHAWDVDGNPIPVVDLVETTALADFAYLPDDNSDISITHRHDTLVVTNRQQTLALVNAWSFRQSYNYIKHGHPNPASVSGGDGDSLDAEGASLFANDDGVDRFDNLSDADAMIQEGTAAGIDNNGQVIRVLFDEASDPAGYYVYYDGDAYPRYGTTDGPDSIVFTAADEIFERHLGNWFRIPDGRGESGHGNLPDPTTDFPDGDRDNGTSRGRMDPDTWPHRLLYDAANNQMLWVHAPWTQLLSGNVTLNRPRSIVDRGGQCIGVNFYSNRLMLTGIESIASSRAGRFFDLWIDNVAATNSEDPSDVDLGFGDTGDALRTSECGERLIIWCEKAQIEFGSGTDALTNVNGRTRLISRFQMLDVQPGEGSNSVVAMDPYRNARLYSFVSPEDGVLLTSHLNIHDKLRFHNFTPLAIFQIENTTLIPESGGDTQVHDRFDIAGSQVQSAWGTFKFLGNLRFAHELDDAIRMVMHDDEGWTLVDYVHQDVEPPTDMAFWPRIDRLERATGVYDSVANVTRFTHTGHTADLERSRVVLASSGKNHQVLAPDSIETDGVMVVPGKWDDEALEPYIGFTYECSLEITKLYAGQSAREILVGQLFVFHHRTTDYEVQIVTPEGQTRISRWSSTTAGVTRLGTPILDTGHSEHSAVGDARFVTINLVHDYSAGQAIWTGLQYWVDATGVGA